MATVSFLPLVAALVMSVPIAGVLILAACKMWRLEGHSLAVVASVVAMLPCHAGFLIGLPIGLWSLIVLSQPDVKAAFRRGGTDDGGKAN